MDYVTCGGMGSYFYFSYDDLLVVPQRLGGSLVATEVVSHARVQAQSYIRMQAAAEEALAAGDADMVSIVRGQIGRPASDGQGPLWAPRRRAPCLYLVQPVVLGQAVVRTTWISAPVTRRRAGSSSGRDPLRRRAVARTGTRRRWGTSRVGGLGGAGRRRRSAATTSRCTNWRTSSAVSGGSPAASPVWRKILDHLGWYVASLPTPV